jgi:hypothetical protein
MQEPPGIVHGYLSPTYSSSSCCSLQLQPCASNTEDWFIRVGRPRMEGFMHGSMHMLNHTWTIESHFQPSPSIQSPQGEPRLLYLRVLCFIALLLSEPNLGLRKWNFDLRNFNLHFNTQFLSYLASLFSYHAWCKGCFLQ